MRAQHHRYIALAIVTAAASMLLAACGREAPKPAPLKLVSVFTVGQATARQAMPADARESSSRSFRDPAALGFDAAGRVMAVLVKPGDQVVAGQALMRLDPRDLALSESSARIQLAAAQAELIAAEADFRRYSDLFAKGFISAAEHQRRSAQMELARARFEASSDQLGYITLRAIEPGTIASVSVKEGALVEPRQLMVRVSLGLAAAGSFAAVSKPAADAAIASRPRIPVSAIVQAGHVYRIVRHQDGTGTLEKRAVRLAEVDEQWATVISGLSAGDEIVAAGTHVLSDQERVRLK